MIDIVKDLKEYFRATGANHEHDFFIEKEQLHIVLNDRVVSVTDISNAGKAGKTCKSITLYRGYFLNRADFCFYNWVNDRGGVDNIDTYKKIFEEFRAELGERNYCELNEYSIKLDNEKGVHTFSPFAGSFERLKKEPKKWTLAFAVRALINGQLKHFKQDYHYTDDYYNDAQNDHGRGAAVDSLEFCEKLLNSPSGWRVSANGNNITLSCHSFKSLSFDFDINGEPAQLPTAEEREQKRNIEIEEQQKKQRIEAEKNRVLWAKKEEKRAKVKPLHIVKYKEEKEPLLIGTIWPNLNKNNTLAEYEENKNDSFIVRSSVEKHIFLSKEDYAIFCENLLADWDFLGGGGDKLLKEDLEKSDYDESKEFWTQSEDFQEFFKKNHVASIIVVECKDTQKRVLVNCQGFKYARYVGFESSLKVAE